VLGPTDDPGDFHHLAVRALEAQPDFVAGSANRRAPDEQTAGADVLDAPFASLILEGDVGPDTKL